MSGAIRPVASRAESWRLVAIAYLAIAAVIVLALLWVQP